MRKLLTIEQIRLTDAFTIQQEPISSIHLMERAALACVNLIQHLTDIEAQNYLVVCGTGNNGGDGLAIARHLKQRGASVQVCLVQGKYSTDNQLNQQRLIPFFVPVFDDVPQIQPGTIIIDALLGTGISGKIKDPALGFIQKINKTAPNHRIISIDIPSGLHGDEINSAPENAVKADDTLTFHSPKKAFFFKETATCCGNIHVLDIGLNDGGIFDNEVNDCLVEAIDIQKLLSKVRQRFSYKGTYGHVLITGGSRNTPGAVVLAAEASVQAGAGLTTVHSVDDAIQLLPAHIMRITDPRNEYITDWPSKKHWSAIGFGPGVGTNEASARVLKQIIQDYKGALVIDADGLNILAENKTWYPFLSHGTILTPHPGELQRLLGQWTDNEEMLKKSRDFAMKYGVILVLKNSYTIIVNADGKMYYNPTGSQFLATAGSGDVLTGIITSFRAQGISAVESAIAGVYIHGFAGQLAATESGKYSISATELLQYISKSIRHLCE